ncbi:MAG: alpha-2-macroglobulin, partial [Chloroflexota bacterium]
FFIVDDLARVGATLHNNTEGPLTVRVTLEAQGVEVKSANEQTVTVEAGRQAYVAWEVKVKNDATRVDLTVTAVSGEYQDASKPAVGTLEGQGIPVYAYRVTETVGTSGVLRDATSFTEAIQLPSIMPFGNASVQVELAPSLAASLVGGLNYLEDFDYLCMEQTVSRFLPNVAAARALELAGRPADALSANLDRQVASALQRIYAKQLPDGGWNWWDGPESDPYTSAYVAYSLIQARLAGYIIDTDTLDRAMAYLHSSLPKLDKNDAEWQYNRQAFIIYVLALDGQLPYTEGSFLFENRARLGNYGKAYLLQAFFHQDTNGSRVKILLSDLYSTAILSAAGAHWEEEETDFWNWNTDLRTTAIVLDAFVKIDPTSALTADAVRWLMAHRSADGWGSTQETAWTLLALTDWLAVSREFESDYSYAVGLNGSPLQRGQVTPANLTESVIVPIPQASLTDQVNYLVIARGAGVGNLYYTAYLNAQLPVDQVKALDRGIIVSRQYFALDDPKHPITEIQRGELARVRVTIVAPAALHYVVVDDPLPAGLEAVDASLQTDAQIPTRYNVTDFERRGWGWWFFTHIELRDEKVVLSADYLPAGTYVFTYLARAGTVGTFNVIPTTASEFYFPDVYGRGDGSVFVVTH